MLRSTKISNSRGLTHSCMFIVSPGRMRAFVKRRRKRLPYLCRKAAVGVTFIVGRHLKKSLDESECAMRDCRRNIHSWVLKEARESNHRPGETTFSTKQGTGPRFTALYFKLTQALSACRQYLCVLSMKYYFSSNIYKKYVLRLTYIFSVLEY